MSDTLFELSTALNDKYICCVTSKIVPPILRRQRTAGEELILNIIDADTRTSYNRRRTKWRKTMVGMLVGKAKVAVIFTRITQGCAAIAEGGGNTEMVGR